MEEIAMSRRKLQCLGQAQQGFELAINQLLTALCALPTAPQVIYGWKKFSKSYADSRSWQLAPGRRNICTLDDGLPLVYPR